MKDRKVTALEQYYEMRVKRIKPLGGYFFEVTSKGSRYKVDLRSQTCTCSEFLKRGVKCKHIWRVEIEGYESPPDEFEPPFEGPLIASFTPDSAEVPEEGFVSDQDEEGWVCDPDFVWFNTMSAEDVRKKCMCVLIAPGKKKDYKFWAAFPGLPRPGTLTVCWGDVNEAELGTIRKLGQSKEINCHAFPEAHKRAAQKTGKGYVTPDCTLKKALIDALVGQFATQGGPSPEPGKAEMKKEEPKKIDWKPEIEDFVWF